MLKLLLSFLYRIFTFEGKGGNTGLCFCIAYFTIWFWEYLKIRGFFLWFCNRSGIYSSLHISKLERWGWCPPCIWEMNYWYACLPWGFLSSLKLPFSWGLAEVRRCLHLKILECVVWLNLLLSNFDYFSLFVLSQLETKLVCNLPAVLTLRSCFPALRETKLFGFCGANHWKLCNFYFCFLAWSALETFFWWLGACILLVGTSKQAPSCSSLSPCMCPHWSHKEATGYFTGVSCTGRGCFPKFHPWPLLKLARRECVKTFTLLILIISKHPFLRALQSKQLSNRERGMKILSILLVPRDIFLLPLSLRSRLFLVCRCKTAKLWLLLIFPKERTLSSTAVTGADKGAGKDHVTATGRWQVFLLKLTLIRRLSYHLLCKLYE